MTIDFTKDEARTLVQLIDLACKAGGLQVAEVAVHLTRKIQPATLDEPIPVEKKTKDV